MKFYEHLGKYLEFCRDEIDNSSLTISMGNEACDPDSFISSLIFAMDRKYVFVLNMREEIVRQKGDIMKIMEIMHMSPDELIYLERPRGRLSREEKHSGTVLKTKGKAEKIAGKTLKLALIDHHHPIPELDGCKIDTIIDHHELGGKSMRADFLFINTKIKSCATLVSKSIIPSKEMAYFLSIPIMLDTSDFRGKDAMYDLLEFKRLQKIGKFKRKEIKRLRKEIKKARKNDSGQSTGVILQKDYKEYRVEDIVFGISTVKYSFKKWIDRESSKLSRDALIGFMNEQGIDAHVVNLKKGDSRYFAMTNCIFENDLVERFSLETQEYKGFKYYKAQAKFSRKVIVPEIRKIIREKLAIGKRDSDTANNSMNSSEE